ncbi:MAG: hypothetical protein WDN28_23580 [Chthoniobacter sp.]
MSRRSTKATRRPSPPLYADDAQYTSDDGKTTIGRAAVLEGLTKFFAENKEAKLGLQIESARFLTPDVLLEKRICDRRRRDDALRLQLREKGWRVAHLRTE